MLTLAYSPDQSDTFTLTFTTRLSRCVWMALVGDNAGWAPRDSLGLLAFIFTLVVSSVIIGVGLDIFMSKDQQNAKKTGSASSHKGKLAEIVLGIISFSAFAALLIKNWPQVWPLLKSFGQGFPSLLLRWDVLTFIGLSTLLSAANLEVQKLSGEGQTLDSISPQDDSDYKVRTYYISLFNYAANALKDASSSYVTAVSILIPASFVIIQVSKSESGKIAGEVMAGTPLVFQGVVWFLISLFFGILTLYRMFTHGRYQDLSRSFFTGVFLNLQFISLFIGVLSLAAGLYYFVFR